MNSYPLPSYRGILTVDAVAYSKNPGRHLPQLSATVHKVVEAAFARTSELGDSWRPERKGDTGDGCFIIVPAEVTPFLVHPLLNHLQDCLEETAPTLAAIGLSLRLRVAIGIGAVPEDRNASTALNNTFRLLDSAPIRAVVDQSEPGVTLLAAILANRVYEDVILDGFTALRPAEFQRVEATVPTKQFVQTAWLRVPRPTYAAEQSAQGIPVASDRDVGPSLEATSKQTCARPSDISTTINGSVGQNVNADSVTLPPLTLPADFFQFTPPREA
ncbi:hypothetical protein ACFYTC_32650 [Actinomadura nitritigenes]|uniref:hypothetical protein n=1 Tax=Actinomadura nitritigenes TaxID=134602 RepID=UPI00369797A2